MLACILNLAHGENIRIDSAVFDFPGMCCDYHSVLDIDKVQEKCTWAGTATSHCMFQVNEFIPAGSRLYVASWLSVPRLTIHFSCMDNGKEDGFYKASANKDGIISLSCNQANHRRPTEYGCCRFDQGKLFSFSVGAAAGLAMSFIIQAVKEKPLEDCSASVAATPTPTVSPAM